MSKTIDKVYVVSHTHWDREWYQDFQGFRTRLVYLIDELLDKLEQDPDYRYFMMDGQTIIIEDYLEIRPEHRERIMTLIRQGRIRVGPWYVMPDEFLVSGESLIRNLLVGFRRARSWGVEPMLAGYITDIFGHNSQFPQLLRGFGIDNAVLFRGFRGEADPSEIRWEGADGSSVLGLKLDEDRSYGDFYFFLRWPFVERDFAYDVEELVARAKAMIAYKADRATTPLVLGLDGVDHVEIEPQLPWLLKTLNEAELGVAFVHTHLEDYLKDVRESVGELQVYKGEQRSPGFSGLNNWVLANVLSSRVHLKQRNHHCETLLERWAEPWSVFTALDGRLYPKRFLAKAWEHLLQNHPHDSICGCSIDQVHQDMIYRFDQARLIGEQMLEEALGYIVQHLPADTLQGDQSFTVFNPSQSPVDGVIDVEIELPASSDAAVTMVQLGGTSFTIQDHEHREVPFQLLEIRRNSVRRRRPYRDIPHADQVDRYRLAFHGKIPAFGYATYLLKKFAIQGPGEGEYRAPNFVAPVRYPGSMRVSEDSWDNGRLRVKVRANGTLEVEDHLTGHSYENLLLLEDEADIGEGWNHVPPVTNEVVTSLGSSAAISMVYDGPFQTRLRVSSSLRVPRGMAGAETHRSEERIDLPVTTFIDLRKDDPVLRCHTVVRNTARDHRLRLLFPTGLEAEHFHTSTPFDLVKRSIQSPDYSQYLERAREVVPHNGVISVDDGHCGLAIYSKGLYEVAAREDALCTVALTLFRSTGKEVLSDGGDGGQLLTTLDFHYALRPFAVADAYPGLLWQEHQHFVAGVRTVDRHAGKVHHGTPQRRTADLPLIKSFLTVSTPAFVVTAIKQSEDRAGSYIVRLLNVTEGDVTGTLSFDRPLRSARLVDLDEQPVADLATDGVNITLAAKAKRIMTVEVAF